MNSFYNENKLILELCKVYSYDKYTINSLLCDNLNYVYVLGQLMNNRIGGAAYFVLNQCGLIKKFNREFRNSLEIVYSYNCIRQDSYCRALDLLFEMFETLDISCALLKGAFLVNVYDKGIRTSNDVDVLVNQNHISEITNILKENGFLQGNTRGGVFTKASRFEIISSRMNRGEIVPFIKELDFPFLKYLEIDINFSLDYKSDISSDLIVKELLDNTEKIIKTEKGYLPSLNKVYFFIQLCMHLYKEATTIDWVKMGRDVSLYKYMDIEVFVYKFFNKEFVKALVRTVGNLKLERECYYVLYYTKLLFGTTNEDLEVALQLLMPTESAYLCQIIDPKNQKLYSFKDDYREWIFLTNKMEHLYEVRNG